MSNLSEIFSRFPHITQNPNFGYDYLGKPKTICSLRHKVLTSPFCPFVGVGVVGESLQIRGAVPNTSCQNCDAPGIVAQILAKRNKQNR